MLSRFFLPSLHRGGLSPMTHLTRLEAWVAAQRDTLEQHGQVTFVLGPPDTDNPSAHLLVALSKDSDVELLLWESGNAEFNRGPFTASVFEHLDDMRVRSVSAGRGLVLLKSIVVGRVRNARPCVAFRPRCFSWGRSGPLTRR